MDHPLSSVLGKRFDQVCFVVKDLEAAVDFWTRTNGIKVWNRAIDLAKEQTDKEYYGQPGNFQFSCAYGYAGETLIELARHDGGNSVYGDWLAEGRSGPHHIGFRQANPQDFARAEAHYRSLGLVKAMGGFFQGPIGNCRWAYYDTRPFIGCFTELYYVDGELPARLDDLKWGIQASVTGQ